MSVFENQDDTEAPKHRIVLIGTTLAPQASSAVKMKSSVFRCFGVVLVCLSPLVLGACSKDSEPVPQSAPIVIAPPPPAPPSVDCPHTGKWATCSVERRLRQAGFVLKKLESDTTKFPSFSVKPIIYQIGKARVQIFLYENESTITHDAAPVDTTRFTLIRSGNLTAIYIGEDPRQSERLALALTAGAPQPGSPR